MYISNFCKNKFWGNKNFSWKTVVSFISNSVSFSNESWFYTNSIILIPTKLGILSPWLNVYQGTSFKINSSVIGGATYEPMKVMMLHMYQSKTIYLYGSDQTLRLNSDNIWQYFCADNISSGFAMSSPWKSGYLLILEHFPHQKFDNSFIHNMQSQQYLIALLLWQALYATWLWKQWV